MCPSSVQQLRYCLEICKSSIARQVSDKDSEFLAAPSRRYPCFRQLSLPSSPPCQQRHILAVALSFVLVSYTGVAVRRKTISGTPKLPFSSWRMRNWSARSEGSHTARSTKKKRRLRATNSYSSSLRLQAYFLPVKTSKTSLKLTLT